MPLYVHFRRIDSEEPKFPIGINLLPEEWDSERQNASAPDIDLILQKEITRIRQEVRKLELEGIEITKDITGNRLSETGQSGATRKPIFLCLFQ